MRSRAKRGFLLKSANLILVAAVWAATAVATAAAATQAQFPAEIGPYLTPQHLVRVDKGRTINLICLGNGSPNRGFVAGQFS